jgi:hypothetical protein
MFYQYEAYNDSHRRRLEDEQRQQRARYQLAELNKRSSSSFVSMLRAVWTKLRTVRVSVTFESQPPCSEDVSLDGLEPC